MQGYGATCALITIIFVFLVLPTYVKLKIREVRANRKYLASTKAGRNEPPSIRPLVNMGLCMGSGACVTACPEDVLGIVDGQARVIAGSKCIGHGVCAAVCPVDAIELYFGSEKRGIDIPEVGSDFETNVRGLFIAGELGGMGLIANAVEQGIQAMGNAAKGLTPGQSEYDVIIVGAGPAGIGATTQAIALGLSYSLLDQETFGGAVRNYPKKKLVMTRPMTFPGYGTVKAKSYLKEELVELFEEVVETTGLQVHNGVRVEKIQAQGAGFTVDTNHGQLTGSRVILAIGRAGTPRKLGVPGEDLEKVAYRLKDAEAHQHEHVLVVGGGDSAIEAAVSLSEQPGNRVTLSYRGKAINRPKEDNIHRLEAAVAAGKIQLMLSSNVKNVEADRVTIEQGEEHTVLPNDAIYVFAGGVLPTKFLQAAGIQMFRHKGRQLERIT